MNWPVERSPLNPDATGITPLTYVSAVLAAFRGDELRARALIDASIRDGTERGEGRAVMLAEYARAVLYNGLGRYSEAQSAAEHACERDDLGVVAWALAELVEAATRNGDRDAAGAGFRRLAERTSPAATKWSRGIEAGARAVIGEDESVEADYQEAIDCLSGGRRFHYRARARLDYGEWLRRQGRCPDAREQLRNALDMFEKMGAKAFAERSPRELIATGETGLKPREESRGALTPQEEQIARRAADGQMNQRIATDLFLSIRTVEWHLRYGIKKYSPPRSTLNVSTPWMRRRTGFCGIVKVSGFAVHRLAAAHACWTLAISRGVGSRP